MARSSSSSTRGTIASSLLLWDQNGFWLHYKRLERGTFKALKADGGERVRISRVELSMLLEGIDLKAGKRVTVA